MNSHTVRNLLVRGMLAGLGAGVLALVVAYLLGEPRIDAAIAFEEGHSHEHGEELVSRTLQSTAGLATGVLLYGLALGGIAALAYCFALGRTGRLGPRATALVAVYLVPFLKYPANPPSVGDPDTIGHRTALYFLMMLLSVLLAVAATVAGKQLAPRLGNWNATLAAALGYAALIGLGYVLLPAINEVPADFSATLLWQFRTAALAIQLTLWLSFGLLFGHLAERLLLPKPVRTPATAVPAAN